MHTSPLVILVCAPIGLTCIAFPIIRRAVASRRITHENSQDVFQQQLALYQRERSSLT